MNTEMRATAMKHLQTLELNPGADQDDVKKAYRDLCFIYHPDRQPARLQSRMTEKMSQINEAHEWLVENAGILSELTPISTPEDEVEVSSDGTTTFSCPLFKLDVSERVSNDFLYFAYSGTIPGAKKIFGDKFDDIDELKDIPSRLPGIFSAGLLPLLEFCITFLKSIECFDYSAKDILGLVGGRIDIDQSFEAIASEINEYLENLESEMEQRDEARTSRRENRFKFNTFSGGGLYSTVGKAAINTITGLGHVAMNAAGKVTDMTKASVGSDQVKAVVKEHAADLFSRACIEAYDVVVEIANQKGGSFDCAEEIEKRRKVAANRLAHAEGLKDDPAKYYPLIASALAIDCFNKSSYESLFLGLTKADDWVHTLPGFYRFTSKVSLGLLSNWHLAKLFYMTQCSGLFNRRTIGAAEEKQYRELVGATPWINDIRSEANNIILCEQFESQLGKGYTFSEMTKRFDKLCGMLENNIFEGFKYELSGETKAAPQGNAITNIFGSYMKAYEAALSNVADWVKGTATADGEDEDRYDELKLVAVKGSIFKGYLEILLDSFKKDDKGEPGPHALLALMVHVINDNPKEAAEYIEAGYAAAISGGRPACSAVTRRWIDFSSEYAVKDEANPLRGMLGRYFKLHLGGEVPLRDHLRDVDAAIAELKNKDDLKKQIYKAAGMEAQVALNRQIHAFVVAGEPDPAAQVANELRAWLAEYDWKKEVIAAATFSIAQVVKEGRGSGEIARNALVKFAELADLGKDLAVDDIWAEKVAETGMEILVGGGWSQHKDFEGFLKNSGLPGMDSASLAHKIYARTKEKCRAESAQQDCVACNVVDQLLGYGNILAVEDADLKCALGLQDLLAKSFAAVQAISMELVDSSSPDAIRMIQCVRSRHPGLSPKGIFMLNAKPDFSRVYAFGVTGIYCSDGELIRYVDIAAVECKRAIKFMMKLIVECAMKDGSLQYVSDIADKDRIGAPLATLISTFASAYRNCETTWQDKAVAQVLTKNSSCGGFIEHIFQKCSVGQKYLGVVNNGLLVYSADIVEALCKGNKVGTAASPVVVEQTDVATKLISGLTGFFKKSKK